MTEFAPPPKPPPPASEPHAAAEPVAEPQHAQPPPPLKLADAGVRENEPDDEAKAIVEAHQPAAKPQQPDEKLNNPVVEADALAEALVAVGIPEHVILRERDAMHTDQNIAWSLNLAEKHGFEGIVVASDTGHAQHGCAMVRAWSDLPCSAPMMDYRRVRDALLTGAYELPDLRDSFARRWPTLLPLVLLIAILVTGRTPYLAAFSGITSCAIVGLTTLERGNRTAN